MFYSLFFARHNFDRYKRRSEYKTGLLRCFGSYPNRVLPLGIDDNFTVPLFTGLIMELVGL